LLTDTSEVIQSNQKTENKKEEVEQQYFPEFITFVDVTEQYIPRPKNRLRRRGYTIRARKRNTP